MGAKRSSEKQTWCWKTIKTKAWYQKSENRAQTIYNTGTYIRDFWNSYDQTSFGLKFDAKKAVANQKLRYGLNFERKEYDSDRYEIRSNGMKPPFSGTYLTASTLDRYALYLSDQFDFEPKGKALSVTPSSAISFIMPKIAFFVASKFFGFTPASTAI